MAAGTIRLGPLAVTTDPDRVSRYAAASRSDLRTVPATWPIVWLGAAEVRAAILSLAQSGEIAFHEEQTFECSDSLRLGCDYLLSVEIERQDAPARIVLAGTVTRSGATVARLRTVLRLIAASASFENARTAVLP